MSSKTTPLDGSTSPPTWPDSTSAIEASLREGAAVGRYRIDEYIGRGGMGEVFRAFDVLLQRPVAMKIVRPVESLTGSPAAQMKRRVLSEARAASQLSHPNVVAIHDVGESEDLSYIVMELVEGHTLRDVAAGQVPASLATRIAWLVQLAEALAAVHGVGLVHRDVKPGNAMVTSSGRVKLLDFGIAKVSALASPPAVGGASLPAATDGKLCGTPAYMAPEQWNGRSATALSDQYGWGLVAFELLSGERASQHGGGADGHALPALEGDHPALGVLDGVIARAVRGDPSQRYPGMAELITALSEVDEVAISSRVRGGTPSVSDGADSKDPVVASARPQPDAGPRTWLLVAALGAACAVLAVWLLSPPRQDTSTPAVVQLALPVASIRIDVPRKDTPSPGPAALRPPTSPRDAFDVLGYLPVAQDAARRRWGDARLEGFYAYPVNEEGLVNLTVTSIGVVHYDFRSPSCCGQAATQSPPCWYRVSVTEHTATGLAGPPANANSRNCSARLPTAPACSLRQVWEAARKRGSPVDTDMAHFQFGPWPEGDWTFSLDGTAFTAAFADTCGGDAGTPTPVGDGKGLRRGPAKMYRPNEL